MAHDDFDSGDDGSSPDLSAPSFVPTSPSFEAVGPGTVLLSSTDHLEPTFRRSVIYMIEHNDAGSLGVVINRMSQTPVHNILPQWTTLAASPRALFVGGPVKQDAALCLGVLKPGVDVDGVREIRPVAGRVALIDLDADVELIERAVEELRIFAGYAGWGIGQLNDELASASWMVAPGLPQDLTAPAQVDVWAQVMRRQPWPMPLLATHPIDVERN